MRVTVDWIPEPLIEPLAEFIEVGCVVMVLWVVSKLWDAGKGGKNDTQ